MSAARNEKPASYAWAGLLITCFAIVVAVLVAYMRRFDPLVEKVARLEEKVTVLEQQQRSAPGPTPTSPATPEVTRTQGTSLTDVHIESVATLCKGNGRVLRLGKTTERAPLAVRSPIRVFWGAEESRVLQAYSEGNAEPEYPPDDSHRETAPGQALRLGPGKYEIKVWNGGEYLSTWIRVNN